MWEEDLFTYSKANQKGQKQQQTLGICSSQQGNSNRWCMILGTKINFFSSKAVFCIVNTFIPMQTQALPIYPWSNNYIGWSYNFNIPPVLKKLNEGLEGT